jgi:hypothetical protein
MTSIDTPKRSAQGLRRVGIAALAALSLGVGLIAPATSAAASDTAVTIVPQAGGFFGEVSSGDDNCELSRDVTLFKVKKKGLKAIGTDVAQPNGTASMWSINTNKKGRFVAKVPATADCVAASSPIVTAQQ